MANADDALLWAQSLASLLVYETAVSAILDSFSNTKETQLKAVDFANNEPNQTLRKDFLLRVIGHIAMIIAYSLYADKPESQLA